MIGQVCLVPHRNSSFRMSVVTSSNPPGVLRTIISSFARRGSACSCGADEHITTAVAAKAKQASTANSRRFVEKIEEKELKIYASPFFVLNLFEPCALFARMGRWVSAFVWRGTFRLVCTEPAELPRQYPYCRPTPKAKSPSQWTGFCSLSS